MSVLIKGMDMPKGCIYCPSAHWNKLDEITGCEIVFGKKFAPAEDKDFWESERPSWCPLVSVPTPHGDLIDTEEIDRALSAHTVVELSQSEWKDIYDAINSVPTVIEAEE